MTRRLRGVLAPATTPFDAAGDVAPEAFAANVRALVAAGVDGVVVAGSTGEAALLEEDERRRLLAAARDEVPSGKLLVMGTGGESTRITIARCRRAAEGGADAALVVAPHYYGAAAMSVAALRLHYEAVAEESPIPVVLYNIPKYMHFALAPELVAELAAHPNVAGIKDSSGDLALLDRYLASQDELFTVLTGHAPTLLAALRRGARGGILAVADFATPLVRRLLQAHATGHPDAEPLQERVARLGAEIVGALGVPGVKAAMDEVGLHGGAPRPPLLPLDEAGRDRVRVLLRATLPEHAPVA